MPPILRSRQVNPPPPPSKSTPRKSTSRKRSTTVITVEPATPNPAHESPKLPRIQSPLGSALASASASCSVPIPRNRRRSLRVASMGCGDSNGAPSSRKHRRSTGKMISSEFGGGAAKGLEDQVVSVLDFDDEGKENVVELVGEPVDEAKTRKKRKLGYDLGDSRATEREDVVELVGEPLDEAKTRKKRKLGYQLRDARENVVELVVKPMDEAKTSRKMNFGDQLCGARDFVKEFGDVRDSEMENVVELVAEPVDEAKTRKKRKFGDQLGSKGGEFDAEILYLGLRSGSRIEKRVSGGRFDYKGKEILIIDSDEEGGEISKSQDSAERNLMTGVRRFSREEKGKGIMINCDPLPELDVSVDLELKLGVGDLDLNAEVQPCLISDQAPLDVNADGGSNAVVGLDELQNANNKVSYMILEQRMRQNKEIAKQNASRFARVSSMEQAENDMDSDAEGEVVQERAEQNIEDWPGPFSTAMKIIRDRQNKGSVQAQHFCMDKSGASRVIWIPNIDQDHLQKTRIVPSLQDLSMKVLVNNSDSITSLEYVPDVLVHKLVSMLCDSRKMTDDILDLLFQGSPSEICITDCSWIAEEQFKKSFEPCNTGNLMVLQLDQCGRCMPDYVVLATLVHKGLPVLTNLSLKGACRLSDDGLKAVISSAPALKSLNLSQCSLITDTGINAIADSLRSGLRELYLDDCQGLNVMLLLPALKRLTNLEVLSLVGIPSVCDKFLQQLIGSIGRNIKELSLADCVRLTDSSLRVISQNCSQLCALDLVNVTKLTDSGIGYLANCCQAIQTLQLCRNTFSDEAIAAFLEACGESIKELSLNNVSMVGPNTSISIARRCKNLVSLDMSWCRSLTDECLGLIADSCQSLRVLKLFGCTQITSRFWAGHSNQDLRVIGINMTQFLENINERDLLQGPLRYSSV